MIADDTPIIPELVAELISREHATELTDRAERHYRDLPSFRKKIRSARGRDILEMFMCHWHTGNEARRAKGLHVNA